MHLLSCYWQQFLLIKLIVTVSWHEIDFRGLLQNLWNVFLYSSPPYLQFPFPWFQLLVVSCSSKMLMEINLIIFKVCAVLSSVMKSCPILHHPVWDVSHPLSSVFTLYMIPACQSLSAISVITLIYYCSIISVFMNCLFLQFSINILGPELTMGN